jgi:hypothetical protein
LPCRKMRCGPFQTNLAASHWFVSSRLISLLVVRTAIIVQPSFSMLSKQGPQRASTAVPGPNCFLLNPTAFRHLRPQGESRYAARALAGGNALFVSDLRADELLGFLAVRVVLPGFCAGQLCSAIWRPNVSSQTKSAIRRRDWI